MYLAGSLQWRKNAQESCVKGTALFVCYFNDVEPGRQHTRGIRLLYKRLNDRSAAVEVTATRAVGECGTL